MKDIFGNTTTTSGFFPKANSSSNTNNFFKKDTAPTTSNNPMIKNPSSLSFNQPQENKPVINFSGSNPSSQNKNTFIMNPQKNETEVSAQQSKFKVTSNF